MIKKVSENKFILTNDFSEFSVILDTFKQKLVNLGISNRDQVGILLSFEELINNAYKHGYQLNLTNKNIDIEYKFTSEKIVIKVIDFGMGFDSTSYEEPDLDIKEVLMKPSGKGIFLVHHYVDKTIIESSINKGTSITIIKYPIYHSEEVI